MAPTVEVDADLIVEDGAGGTRQLSVDDFKSVSAVRLDEAGAVTYVGEAPAGSGDGDAVWRIKRIAEAAVTAIEWADGDTDFDNVWTNRANLSYA